jgi:hypothetical protein
MTRPFDNQEETLQANLEDLKKIKESEHLSPGDKKRAIAVNLPKVHGRWTEVQNVLLDIEVGYRVKMLAGTEQSLPSIPEMINNLETELRIRFKDAPDYLDLMTSALPTKSTVSRWFKKAEWKEEIEKRLKDGNLFSLDKRAAMIESLYKKGMSGDNKSAEMWLKMSGDLTNQPATKDKAVDAFKQLSESLFNGKE